MAIFFRTFLDICRAFLLIFKSDANATKYVQVDDVHFILSWLMVPIALFIYMLFLPAIFVNEIAQGYVPENADYGAYRSAGFFSLTGLLLLGYGAVFVMINLLGYQGSFRRYVVAQNWLFLLQVPLVLPLMLSGVSDAAEPSASEAFTMIAALLFLIIIIWFVFQCLRILLDINGVKAGLLLLLLMTLEITVNDYILVWHGLPPIYLSAT